MHIRAFRLINAVVIAYIVIWISLEEFRRFRLRQQWSTFRANAPSGGGHIEGDEVDRRDNNIPPAGGHLSVERIPAGGGLTQEGLT